MKNCNLIFLFITLASLMLDAHCELSEKELEDIENDMVGILFIFFLLIMRIGQTNFSRC